MPKPQISHNFAADDFKDNGFDLFKTFRIMSQSVVPNKSSS
jgi:hypothetical protein